MDEQTEPTSEQTPDETAESSSTPASDATRRRILREMKDRYDQFDTSTVKRLEIVCLFLIIVLCDVAIYRGSGFAGYAALVSGLAVLLVVGVPTKRAQLSTWLFGILVAGVSARLAWCGSGLSLTAGVVVLFCFAMSLVGRTPYLIHAAVFASQTFAAGHAGLNHYWASLSRIRPPARVQNVLAFVLPVFALLVFGTLFLFANPDLLKTVGAQLSEVFATLGTWIQTVTPSPFEVLFCIAAGWIAIGLLRPILPQAEESDAEREEAPEEESAAEPKQTPLFEAFRNTLFVVVGLFGVYLVFEFQTLWFREFPEGFHYSGYAHEGAAWLTVALGLATVMLSLMFRGSVLNDPRLRLLRKLS